MLLVANSDTTLSLSRTVVRIESNYDVRALSSAGAMGLMQLMPQTARELGVKDPWDAQSNLDGGTRYLVALLKEFGDAEAALVGYNAGPEVVRAGKQPPLESQRYVRDVLRVFRGLGMRIAKPPLHKRRSRRVKQPLLGSERLRQTNRRISR